MQAADKIILACPEDSFGPVVARSAEVLGSNPVQVGCSSSSLCILQCSKLFNGLECVVLSVVLCTIKSP